MAHPPSCLLALAFVALGVVGCGGSEGGGPGGGRNGGEIRIDGSSTVFPISEAVAEEFQTSHPDVRVIVGFSGSGGGFERFCTGEIDIANASREMEPSEVARCRETGVEYTSLRIGWDGISLVVNPANTFAQCLTQDELRRIWEPDGLVRSWQDIRDEWPDEEILLYGPGTDSGTFDYFTETLFGQVGASRSDFQASEDDNILVQGVASDPYALGYFGYAYFSENQDRLRLLSLDSGQGCVAPSDGTIEDGTYVPFSRPLFLYLNRASLSRASVASYVAFMLENASDLVRSTGYHPLEQGEYDEYLASLGPEVKGERP